MNFNGFVNIEDLLKACGYNNSSSNSNNSSNNNSNNSNNSNSNNSNNSSSNNNNSNSDNYGCSDIPNGFQSIPPELVAIIGEVLGNIIAGNIPFNLQNIIGNWFELVGQVILVFNAQQQYFQGGPGRYFDPKNYNIDNPFCTNNSTSTNSNTSNSSTSSNTSSSSKSSSSKSNDINKSKIEALERQVQELTNEINKIRILLQEK